MTSCSTCKLQRNSFTDGIICAVDVTTDDVTRIINRHYIFTQTQLYLPYVSLVGIKLQALELSSMDSPCSSINSPKEVIPANARSDERSEVDDDCHLPREVFPSASSLLSNIRHTSVDRPARRCLKQFNLTFSRAPKHHHTHHAKTQRDVRISQDLEINITEQPNT